jgi:hypothetical protein
VKISCKEGVHICRTNFAKKWNEICMKQLAGRKCIKNDCFLRTLKFKMKQMRRYYITMCELGATRNAIQGLNDRFIKFQLELGILYSHWSLM